MYLVSTTLNIWPDYTRGASSTPSIYINNPNGMSTRLQITRYFTPISDTKLITLEQLTELLLGVTQAGPVGAVDGGSC